MHDKLHAPLLEYILSFMYFNLSSYRLSRITRVLKSYRIPFSSSSEKVYHSKSFLFASLGAHRNAENSNHIPSVDETEIMLGIIYD